jgi:hypothetical protein
MSIEPQDLQRKTALFPIVYSFLILGVFWLRYAYLVRQPFLWGPDAYYYGLQIKFFSLTGAFKIADRSLVLPLMGWTAKFGLSYQASIILWVSLIQLFCGLNVILANRILRRDFQISQGIFWGLYLMVSPTMTFLCLIFPKYAFSLIFMPFWPSGLIKPKYWPLTLLSVIISGLNHLTMLAIIPLVFGTVALSRRDCRQQLLKSKWRLFGSCLVILVLSLMISRKYLLWSDLQRIDWQGLQPVCWTLLSRAGIPGIIKVETILTFVIFGWLFLSRKSMENPSVSSLFWLPLVLFLLIIPLGSREMMGIAERLALLTPVVMILLLAEINMVGFTYEKRYTALLGVMLLFTGWFPHIYFHWIYPNYLNPDYALYHQITRKLTKMDIPMLIAHQGLNYYYKYLTMKESFPYAPEDHWPKPKIWRVVFGVTPQEWSYYLPERYGWGSGLLVDLPGAYSLIREDGWNEFCNQIRQKSGDHDLYDRVFRSWRNPSQKRPEFSRQRSKDGGKSEFSPYPSQKTVTF